MDIKLLVNISARAWAMPILSSLASGVPGRQAPLLDATGASRSAFTQSLDHLIDLGLLERNPGYGHPLRPEFRLTRLGKKSAELAANLPVFSDPTDHTLLRRSWTLPVLACVHRPIRFNEIKRHLGTITDRALSNSLVSLQDRCWVDRRVDEIARPPSTTYCATHDGERVARVLAPEVFLRQKPAH